MVSKKEISTSQMPCMQAIHIILRCGPEQRDYITIMIIICLVFIFTNTIDITDIYLNRNTYLQSCVAMSLEDSTKCAPVCINNWITSNFLVTNILVHTYIHIQAMTTHTYIIQVVIFKGLNFCGLGSSDDFVGLFFVAMFSNLL